MNGTHLTLAKSERGDLEIFLGRPKAGLTRTEYDSATREFVHVRILGSVKLPRPMTLDEARLWANETGVLQRRFPEAFKES